MAPLVSFAFYFTVLELQHLASTALAQGEGDDIKYTCTESESGIDSEPEANCLKTSLLQTQLHTSEKAFPDVLKVTRTLSKYDRTTLSAASQTLLRAGVDAAAEVTHMPCGVLAFLHIGKTGGTSVAMYLKDQAPRANFTHYDVWSDGSRPLYNFSEDKQWVAFKQQAYGLHFPKLTLHLHHGVPGIGRYLWDAELAPMQQMLNRKGCELRLTTVLRGGSSRAISSFNYYMQEYFPSYCRSFKTLFGMPNDECVCICANGSANTQVSTIQFGHLAEHSIWSGDDWFQDTGDNPLRALVSGDEESNRLWAMQTSLVLNQTFYMVGNTNMLDDFTAAVDKILGAPASQLRHDNPTLYSAKLSTTALSCIDAANRADNVLYELYFPAGED